MKIHFLITSIKNKFVILELEKISLSDTLTKHFKISTWSIQ